MNEIEGSHYETPQGGSTGVGYTQSLPIDDMSIVISALEEWKGGAPVDRQRAKTLAMKCRMEGGLDV